MLGEGFSAEDTSIQRHRKVKTGKCSLAQYLTLGIGRTIVQL